MFGVPGPSHRHRLPYARARHRGRKGTAEGCAATVGVDDVSSGARGSRRSDPVCCDGAPWPLVDRAREGSTADDVAALASPPAISSVANGDTFRPADGESRPSGRVAAAHRRRRVVSHTSCRRPTGRRVREGQPDERPEVASSRVVPRAWVVLIEEDMIGRWVFYGRVPSKISRRFAHGSRI